MGKVWVLDTDTKGTGAQMVPLEKVLRQPEAVPERPLVPPEPKPRPEPEPEPRPPARFKVVAIMTRQVLAEGGGLRATLEALADVRSVVDVSVYARDGDDDWRLLTQRERRLLWELRDRPR